MKEYYSRISDKVLEEHLESKGAVLIEGPNWKELGLRIKGCGKYIVIDGIVTAALLLGFLA